MGYKAAGDDEGMAGENNIEYKNDTSEDVMEEISVSVNLETAWVLKIETGGGTRLSDGIAACARRSSASHPGKSLFRSAD